MSPARRVNSSSSWTVASRFGFVEGRETRVDDDVANILERRSSKYTRYLTVWYLGSDEYMATSVTSASSRMTGWTCISRFGRGCASDARSKIYCTTHELSPRESNPSSFAIASICLVRQCLTPKRAIKSKKYNQPSTSDGLLPGAGSRSCIASKMFLAPQT